MSKKPYKPIPKYRHKLSGLTAARLILADNVEVDNGRPPILTEAQFEAIIRGKAIASHKDAQVLQTWHDVYRMAALTIREAKVKGQEAIITLLKDCYYFSSLQYAAFLHGHEECSKTEEIREALLEVRDSVSLVLAALSVLEAVSDTIQVKLTESIEALLERLVKTATIYNFHVNGLALKENKKESLLLELREVTAIPEYLRYFEERIDMSLGAGWRKAPFPKYAFTPGEDLEGCLWHDIAEIIAEEVYKL